MKKAFDKEQKGLETLTRNYILANTDNVTSIYLFLQNSFLFSPEEQRELIAHAAPSFKKNPAVKKVSHMLDRLKNVSTYIDKGKYILLDFWASWCPPCRRQTPYLKQLFERYDKRQFSIVGISFDTNREEWKEYIQKNQIKWAQLIDQKGWESTAILTYAIQGIPHLILLGPDGKIIANNPSEKQLSNILSNQLKQ